MTEQQVKQAVLVGLKRSKGLGDPDRAQAIVDSIKFLQEMDSVDEGDPGRTETPAPKLMQLPASAAVVDERDSRPEKREYSGAAIIAAGEAPEVDHHINKRRSTPEAVEYNYWKPEDLIEWLKGNAPPLIRVVPEGSEHEIELAMSTEFIPGWTESRDYSAVKLVYRLSGVENNSSNEAGRESGIITNTKELPRTALRSPGAAVIGLGCSHLFQTALTPICPDLDKAIEDIKRQAVVVFKPRPKNMPSKVPLNTSAFSMRTDDIIRGEVSIDR